MKIKWLCFLGISIIGIVGGLLIREREIRKLEKGIDETHKETEKKMAEIEKMMKETEKIMKEAEDIFGKETARNIEAAKGNQEEINKILKELMDKNGIHKPWGEGPFNDFMKNPNNRLQF